MPPEEAPPVPAGIPPLSSGVRSTDAPSLTPPAFTPPAFTPGPGVVNGVPLRLNIHPAMLSEVTVVPFSPAPESHLLDLHNSH